ncbi:hypothetical protein NCC49_004127 [Naganishia albida]|nr:hypothetical protein NCC49_004127 [Naganishia albida]
MQNLQSASTDSLPLPHTRGRSRAKPIHLVRQALGVPHFRIVPGAIAPRSEKQQGPTTVVPEGGTRSGQVVGGGVPWPILSRLPLEVVTLGNGDTLSEEEDADTNDDEAPRLLHSSPSQFPRVLYTRSRLPDITENDIHLWRALHHFRPLDPDYARAFRLLSDSLVVPHNSLLETHSDTCPGFSSRAEAYIPLIQQTFNYPHLPALPLEVKRKYYGVLFRSTRRPGSSSHSLYTADRLAHEEAVASGGLLFYWYGAPDENGDNVATCLWASREDARRASTSARHRVAAGLAKGVYERYELIRYVVERSEGETGLRVGLWEDQIGFERV